ncbi:general transcription factor [Lithospermum erythrorhizon]|uniref:General transcription factor n=1 Tax=Lithospermum erythrorhizon TaxID=34254 RepID=A0AAV3PDH8_LITER
MSIGGFNRLVKLAGRAFYDDMNRGIAVVVLDALTSKQWVREQDLSKQLQLHAKLLRTTLRFLEQEKFISVYHRKEPAGEGEGEGGHKVMMHTYTYYCLDYPQIYDVLRYRLRRMTMSLKDKLNDKIKIQAYLCLDCGKRYNALDVDVNFCCDGCKTELVEATDGNRDKYKDMLGRMDVQLKPLLDQLNLVKDLPVPELFSLQVRGHSIVGEPKIEITISGVDDTGGSVAAPNGNASIKVFPSWMINQDMNLTKEQRGEFMDGSLAPLGSSDDKKKVVSEAEDSNNLQGEYVKAYYDALLQRQRHQELFQPPTPMHTFHERVVGEKSKRGDNDDGEDVKWEEEAPGCNNTSENLKADFNVEAGVSEEDGIDWEEG